MKKKWLLPLSVIVIVVCLFSQSCTTQVVYYGIMAPPEPDWNRQGVVLDLGDKGAYDDKNIESPIIVKTPDGKYTMWYRGQSSVDDLGRVMRAVSDDGIHWTKTGVVLVPAKSYEGNKIDPMTVMYEDGIYKMWYGGEENDITCACYATSQDGITWKRYADNPILNSSKHSWDNQGAGGQHSVVRTETGYLMIYKGYGDEAEGWSFYGLAESDDGIHWDKKGKVISPQPELGETTSLRNLCVIKIGDTYCLFHAMADYLNLFLVTSQDGVNWDKKGIVFAKGLTPGGWDIKWATSPWFIVEGDKVRMWYEGGDINGRVRTLYAEINLSDLTNQFRISIQPISAQ